MARKRPPREDPDDSIARLTIPRGEAQQRLDERIEYGKSLLVRSQHRIFGELMAEYKKWNEFNVTLLKRIFDKPLISKKYEFDMDIQVGRNEYDSYRINLERKVVHLESLVGQLPLYDEAGAQSVPHQPASSVTSVPATDDTITGDVFLVHGHDAAVKHEVARFLEKLGLRVIILHEQPDESRTIIEKFEHYARPRFAVILLTADDVGCSKLSVAKPETLSFRARQNVVFEFGYFIGKLGRKHVTALLEKGVEKPSDIDGLLYTALDEDWKLKLTRRHGNSHSMLGGMVGHLAARRLSSGLALRNFRLTSVLVM